MKKMNKFEIKLEERFLENYAAPHEDTLGELSDFELGLRRFCYEYDHKVLIKIGEETFRVFFDPDICMILEDDLPKQIAQLEYGKAIELEFAESCWLIVKLTPMDDMIDCHLKDFGYSTQERLVELDKNQVLSVLRGFLDEVMQLAVNTGYVTLEDTERFIAPAFPERVKVTSLVG